MSCISSTMRISFRTNYVRKQAMIYFITSSLFYYDSGKEKQRWRWKRVTRVIFIKVRSPFLRRMCRMALTLLVYVSCATCTIFERCVHWKLWMARLNLEDFLRPGHAYIFSREAMYYFTSGTIRGNRVEEFI